jgi:uncharacterized membrane protein
MADQWLPQPPRSSRQAMFVVACWLLVVISGAIAVLLAIAGPMSSDSCRPDDVTFRCSVTGQNVAFWLPISAWILSILVAWATTVHLNRKRQKSSWFGLAVGGCIFVVAMIVEWLVVSRQFT